MVKEYRFIRNKALLDAIKVYQIQKLKEHHLDTVGHLGVRTLFEVDLEKIGNVITFIPVFENESLHVLAHIIIPIQIFGAQNVKEIVNDMNSNKPFKFQLSTPIIKYSKLGDSDEIYRYTDTISFSYLIKLRFIVKPITRIYNITPPSEFPNNVFIILETNDNGQIYIAVFDVTIRNELKLVKTNDPNMVRRRKSSVLRIIANENKNNNKTKNDNEGSNIIRNKDNNSNSNKNKAKNDNKDINIIKNKDNNSNSNNNKTKNDDKDSNSDKHSKNIFKMLFDFGHKKTKDGKLYTKLA